MNSCLDHLFIGRMRRDTMKIFLEHNGRDLLYHIKKNQFHHTLHLISVIQMCFHDLYS